MSFSADCKAELCREKLGDLCCAQAEAYGVLLFCNQFSGGSIRITTQNDAFAQRLPRLFRRAFGVEFDRTPEQGQSGKRTFEICSGVTVASILDLYGYEAASALSNHINFAVVEEECCRTAFLRGVFLAGGSVTDPQKRYHLEISTSHFHVHRELQALLPEAGFSPRETRRGGNYITYFKQSEVISDFLTTIGAPVASMDVMNAKVEKYLMNGVNRRLNCDVANVEKSVQAAQTQIECIRRLKRSGELEHLPEKLRETARIREENPELSLSQLAELFPQPVTKSCLNHRLRKLTELGQEE